MKYALTLFALIVLGCSSNEPNNEQEDLIVSQAIYRDTSTEQYTILDATIEGDELSITIQSGGCDGSNWEIRLVDSGSIAESYPVQRYIKVALTNNESCDALVTQTKIFDISSLQVEDQLFFNLEGWDEQLHYDF